MYGEEYSFNPSRVGDNQPATIAACNGGSYQTTASRVSGRDNDETPVTVSFECCSDDECNEESTAAASFASAAVAALVATVAVVASF